VTRILTSTLSRIIASAMLMLVFGCAGGGVAGGPTFAQAAAQLPPVPADRARIFFYRDYEPYDSMGRPYIALSGQVAAISEPGGVSYRDVPPGRYVISVRYDTLYPDQDKTVTVGAGQTVYAKIESLKSYNDGAGFWNPDTFDVVIVDPADGQREIASKRYFADGS
jgi:hypothetical protein